MSVLLSSRAPVKHFAPVMISSPWEPEQKRPLVPAFLRGKIILEELLKFERDQGKIGVIEDGE
jgi:hypothetical protein